MAATGYMATALGTGGFALAGPWGVVAFFRALAWAARGLRAPARDSLLAGAVTPEQRGRAFGLERAGDSVGAVLGPLLAAALLGALGFKWIFVLSVIPGMLAAAAVWRLVEETPRTGLRETRVTLSGLPRGSFRQFAVGYGLYGLGNFAPTLLVLHATELLQQEGASRQPRVWPFCFTRRTTSRTRSPPIPRVWSAIASAIVAS